MICNAAAWTHLAHMLPDSTDTDFWHSRPSRLQASKNFPLRHLWAGNLAVAEAFVDNGCSKFGPLGPQTRPLAL